MTDPAEQGLAAAEGAVAAALACVRHEIAAYPRPISGCDAQFNRLLELRVRLDFARDALAAPVRIPTSRHPD